MVPYVGSKEVHADTILDFISLKPGQKFCDLCCGAGAVSRKLVARGFDPFDIIMVDGGPWGLFWNKIGRAEFSLGRFSDLCDEFAKDPRKWSRDTLRDELDSDTVYRFILLQSMSWQGTAVKFTKRNTFSTVSLRPSPAPKVEKLFGRVVEVVATMRGVDGRMGDVRTFVPDRNCVLFYDPPYGVDHYQATMKDTDIVHTEYYITYSYPLSAESVPLTQPLRRPGKRMSQTDEYLSLVKREQCRNFRSN